MRTTKRVLYIIILGILLQGINGCVNAQPKERFDEKQVVKMLESFYKEYITERCTEDSLEQSYPIVSKFGTANLLSEIKNPKFDYNPLLGSNSCDKEWLKTLMVTKDVTKNNIYYVSYEWPNNEKITIKLLIVKVNSEYKIDCVYFEDLSIECPCPKE